MCTKSILNQLILLMVVFLNSFHTRDPSSGQKLDKHTPTSITVSASSSFLWMLLFITRYFPVSKAVCIQNQYWISWFFFWSSCLILSAWDALSDNKLDPVTSTTVATSPDSSQVKIFLTCYFLLGRALCIQNQYWIIWIYFWSSFQIVFQQKTQQFPTSGPTNIHKTSPIP